MIKLFILLLLFWVQTYVYMLKKKKIAKFYKLQCHLSLKITKAKYSWNVAHDFLQTIYLFFYIYFFAEYNNSKIKWE